MRPESHLRYHSERHADLVREVRRSRLASSLGVTRRSPHSQLARGLWRNRLAGRPTLGRIERERIPRAWMRSVRAG